jgi:hypothetical protein
MYLCTTTTNLRDFEPGGKREHHTTCLFKTASPDSPFDEDCILDIDEGPYSLPEAQISNNKDIEIKGKIGEQDMRMIYNRVVRSHRFSNRVKRDIHQSFNDAGITGLRMPK